jgi:hypothetical protein
LFVFTIFKSATGLAASATGSVSVDELFPDTGSVTPVGGDTDASFDTDGVPVFTTFTTAVTDTVYVLFTASTGRVSPPLWRSFTDNAVAPESHMSAFDSAYAHTTPITVNPVPGVSTSFAPVTVEGPRFVTVTVYVVDVPFVTPDTPFDFTTRRSACGIAFVSESESFAEAGSVVPTGGATATVFVIVVTSFATSTVAFTVKTYVSFTSMRGSVNPGDVRTSFHDLPSGKAGSTTHRSDPTPALQTTSLTDIPVGMVSVTLTPVTDDGPKFVTVTVYVVVDPSVSDDSSSDFWIFRSATGVTVIELPESVLFPGTGSVVEDATVAEFVTSPPPAVGTLAVPATITVNVSPGRNVGNEKPEVVRALTSVLGVPLKEPS